MEDDPDDEIYLDGPWEDYAEIIRIESAWKRAEAAIAKAAAAEKAATERAAAEKAATVEAAEMKATEVQQISEGRKSEVIASDAVKVANYKADDRTGCTNVGSHCTNDGRSRANDRSTELLAACSHFKSGWT